MKKNLIAWILCLSLLLTFFTGCGAQSAAEEAASEPSAAVSSESSEAPSTEEDAAQAAEIAVENQEEPEAAETQNEVGSASISYPLADGGVLTAWVNLDTPFRQAIEDWNDLSVLPEISAATGVDLKFTTVSSDAASEQFPLMIAGGDWTDLIPISYYTGGDAQAYEDEVIVDLTDLL